VDGLRRYDELFSRLLFDRRFRERMRAGDWSLLGAEAEAFSVVDLDISERLALAIRDGLIGGSLGGLGLGQAFPRTIAALGGGVEAVAERFLEAHHEAQAFDGTCRQAGVSVFESFHGWADRQLEGRPADRRRAQHELAAGLLVILAGKPNPGFRVEWPLARPIPCGWYCVLDAVRPLAGPADPPEQPVAYVAALGQYVTGEDAADFAAVALDAAGAPPPWASRRLAQLDPVTLGELRGVLSSRGSA
jgi:hypothetical protein